MSLRTDYALSSALTDAYTAGKAWIGTLAVPGTAYATLSAALAAASAQGKENFTTTILVAYSPAALRLKNKIMLSFFDGIYAALSEEGIMTFEVNLALNTSDNINTSIDFNFSF